MEETSGDKLVLIAREDEETARGMKLDCSWRSRRFAGRMLG